VDVGAWLNKLSNLNAATLFPVDLSNIPIEVFTAWT
jgi:hypothetical protein